MPRTKNPNCKGRQAVLRAYRDNPGASLQELVRATGFSQTAVYYHLRSLRDEGVITRENKPRGVQAWHETKKTNKKNKSASANKQRSRKECERQKKMRAERNARSAGLKARIEKVVQAAKENGTYYGM